MASLLLTRDQFHVQALTRDGGHCVVCKQVATEIHHCIERRLFSDGGYYIENGISLCNPCHVKAEQTLISCEELRELAGIQQVILPEHLYADQVYDKWANPILPNGRRLRGELFDDPSVRKILDPVLHLFDNRIKHSRTFHFPWSETLTADDRRLNDLSGFIGREVVVTVKVDGEQCSLYQDYIHARSVDYHPHPSRNWVKALHGRIAHEIGNNIRICGENLYAKHSIHYQHLPSLFLVHSVWDGNMCLSWDDTKTWAELLDLKVVDELYRGQWNEKLIRGLYTPTHKGDECEGYVCRITDAFPYRDYRKLVAKMVRVGHVQSHAHWMQQAIITNQVERGAQC